MTSSRHCDWPAATLQRHTHHHHRFDIAPAVPGAEMETSRGCPYHCTFCAKENFRDRYRRRPLATILDELDALIAAGVGYVYFIDEIFLPWRELLEAIARAPSRVWCPDPYRFVARRHARSAWGRRLRVDRGGGRKPDPRGPRLARQGLSGVSTDELTRRLVHAKRSVAFVQANLIATPSDNPAEVERWRAALRENGVWANEPVPLFPYPGSPDYRRLWGLPDDFAWERAVDYYLDRYAAFSDIQEARPQRLHELETAGQ